MNKILFLIFFTINIFYLYADGRMEKDRQPYTQIQLRIINKSNSSIKFYYNRLYNPVVVNANEEFISMKMPQNSEFAGYFAIEYENGSFRIYKRQTLLEHGPERIDIYYNVFIENNELKIIRANSSFEDNKGWHDEFYWGRGWFFESKSVMTDGGMEIFLNDNTITNIGLIEIIFDNNTNEKTTLTVFEPFSDFIRIELDAGKSFNYRIRHDIFDLHGFIKVRIGNRLFHDEIQLFPRNLYTIGGKRVLIRSLSKIEIVITENGYTKRNIFQYY